MGGPALANPPAKIHYQGAYRPKKSTKIEVFTTRPQQKATYTKTSIVQSFIGTPGVQLGFPLVLLYGSTVGSYHGLRVSCNSLLAGPAPKCTTSLAGSVLCGRDTKAMYYMSHFLPLMFQIFIACGHFLPVESHELSFCFAIFLLSSPKSSLVSSFSPSEVPNHYLCW